MEAEQKKVWNTVAFEAYDNHCFYFLSGPARIENATYEWTPSESLHPQIYNII